MNAILSDRPFIFDNGPAHDTDLTAFLAQQIAGILSDSHSPRPPCPRCGSAHVHRAGHQKRKVGNIALFKCIACKRHFNRASGTPLSDKHLKRLDLFLPLLSQPLTCGQAAQTLRVRPTDVKLLTKAFRQWLLRLDPGGSWEKRVRLGGRLTELTPSVLPFEEAGIREDLELSARLGAGFDNLHAEHIPPAACPGCGCERMHLHDRSQDGLPAYRCAQCFRRFTRRVGTPFERCKRHATARMRQTIRYLALPLSLMQVADIVGTSAPMIRKWRDMFIAYADQLEPDGSLSTRILLGAEPGPATPCTFCGRIGTAVQTNRQRWTCSGCRRLFSMRRQVVEIDNQLRIINHTAC